MEEGIGLADELVSTHEALTVPSKVRVVHGQIRTTLDKIADLARRMLDGLRSADAGEARTEALGTSWKPLADWKDRSAEQEQDSVLPRPLPQEPEQPPPSAPRPPTTVAWTKDEEFEAVLALVGHPGLPVDDAKDFVLATCAVFDAGASRHGILLEGVIIWESLGLSHEDQTTLVQVMAGGVAIYCSQHADK